MLKKIVTFRPSFTLRILTGLVAFLFMLSVCTLTYVADITTTLSERDLQFRGRLIEQGARYYKDQCARCHGPEGKGIDGIAPGISNENFLGQVEFREVDGQRVIQQIKPSKRLAELGYKGTLRDYIRSVIASGLPIKSSADWADPHPPFLDSYGGPLRDDQVDNITSFVINWAQAPKPDGESILPPPPGSGGAPKPTAVPLTADQEAGKQVYLKAGCNACHAIKGVGNQGAVGPNLSKIYTLSAETIASADYKSKVKDQPASTTPEDFIKQSIHYPNAYIAPQCPTGACPAGVMPQNFKDTIPAADFDKLVAYLSMLK
ncbi:MAG: c-type cytochrome [Chloroflexi bacterium]|nr:c-type cytochrome [Chloroflexota bacterium]